jgi:hypothetical protein
VSRPWLQALPVSASAISGEFSRRFTSAFTRSVIAEGVPAGA